ncbi:TetR family transcriptional regulator [Rhizocola hellebori]|uniref:TetR family transcriptional regulator n=1 Tax=Rhizocola hellebori TaxID=1392758 RepID=A0A8J3VI60_9ACTN|nr:TetR/AcrR family transcriptional regulator [Rhizocola hellebori]GIH07002.1 TetR family transcriptional regulator [Rhizocola hellebori]
MEKLPGRRGQAVRNDAIILEAARNVFLEDPSAPIAAVAERAGVGFSALYRRYAGKEQLLRQLCHDGLKRFIAEADTGLADSDGWRGLTGFIERIVDADVHSLTVKLAGTFTPTPEMNEDAKRANKLAVTLVKRAHESGRLRSDVVPDDLDLLLEGCAAIRLPDPDRTRQLRKRYLALLIRGLSADDAKQEPLPGPAPDAQELNWRWTRRPQAGTAKP